MTSNLVWLRSLVTSVPKAPRSARKAAVAAEAATVEIVVVDAEAEAAAANW